MKATVVKEVSFDAAHHLPYYEGKCSKPHGHHWKIEVALVGEVSPQSGILVDFTWLKQVLEEEVVSKFDHTNLNDFFDNPTAELVAAYIRDKIELEYIQGPGERIQLAWVKVWETPTSHVIVRGEGKE